MDSWLASGPVFHILGAILVTSSSRLVYAAVRYSVATPPEFDERVDGTSTAQPPARLRHHAQPTSS